MGERIGRIRTDFFGVRALEIRQKSKKIRFNPPDPPNPFSHRITKPPNEKYSITRIYVQKEERPFCSIKPLGFYEKLLAGRFFRVHHGVLVNKDYIQAAQKREHTILLTTGEVILVSMRRWTDFLKWFNDNDE
jgi:hypothetical protein